jgi:hypothetical protein
MEMFPEEFVAKQYGGTHKWTEIIQYGMIGVLTDKEKQLLEEGLKKATRKVFSQRVAANIMYIENETLKPTRTVVTPTTPQISPTGTVTIPQSSTTSLNVSSTNNFAVRDKSGRVVIMHEHEYKYYLKQDPKRQESYLEWIKRGRR